jgi:transcription elongation factor S-II
MSSIESIAYPDQFRNEVKNRIHGLLTTIHHHEDGGVGHESSSCGGGGGAAGSAETIDSISTNIEKGIFNWAVQHASKNNIVKKWSNPFFVRLYIDHLRSVYINLKKPDVSSAVISGNIQSQKIAFMTHQEICPDKWKQLVEDKKVRDKQKYEPNIEASTDNFTCNKCKSKKCTYYQLQTRSADEPMTTFVTCLECGKRWKC